jgi:hypothetical protein
LVELDGASEPQQVEEAPALGRGRGRQARLNLRGESRERAGLLVGQARVGERGLHLALGLQGGKPGFNLLPLLAEQARRLTAGRHVERLVQHTALAVAQPR